MFRQMPKLPLFKEYKGLFTLAVQTSGRRHRRKIKENLLYSCVFVSTFALLVYECRLIPSRFLAAEERRRRGFWEGDEGRAKGYGKDESGINVCSHQRRKRRRKSGGNKWTPTQEKGKFALLLCLRLSVYFSNVNRSLFSLRPV